MIDQADSQLSTRQQCGLLSVSRSSLYYRPVGLKASDVLLMNEIKDLWLQYPFYGYRRITAHLRHMGYQVNRKRVQRLMQIMELQAIFPKPNTSKANKAHSVYPYLLEERCIHQANEAWEVDITYLKHQGSFMYLVALIDVHSRYVVSWSLSNTMHTEFCLDALNKALSRSKPKLINSDQGSQFTSESWVSQLKKSDIEISMTGKGRCHDNIHIERFWRSIKYEFVFLNDHNSVSALKQGITEYIEFYNHKRLHQSLDYKTPAEVYFGQRQESEELPIYIISNLQTSKLHLGRTAGSLN